MKLGKYAWGIWGITLVVALAFAFLLPFTYNVVYLIALLSMLLAFAVCAWTFWRSFSAKNELFSKYMGWPIFKVGLIVLAVQLALSFVLMTLASLCPVFVAALLEIVLFAVAGVCLLTREAARQVVTQTEESLPDRTAAWKEVRRKAALVDLPENREWQKVLENIRYADPTDNETTLAHTKRILEILDGRVDADAILDIQKLMLARKQRK